MTKVTVTHHTEVPQSLNVRTDKSRFDADWFVVVAYPFTKIVIVFVQM